MLNTPYRERQVLAEIRSNSPVETVLLALSEEADEILRRPAFPFIKTRAELDLVVLSVLELGFGDRASRYDLDLGTTVQVALHDVYARAIALGFELCPAEVGPALRIA